VDSQPVEAGNLEPVVVVSWQWFTWVGIVPPLCCALVLA
jgi:hypothetical protein